MGAGLFWGLILIVIGLSIIFRIFFDINVFRIVIAIVFILIGIKILIGKPVLHASGNENDVFFGEKMISSMPEDGMTYNTVAFGSIIYVSDNVSDTASVLEIEAHVVFGALVIKQ